MKTKHMTRFEIDAAVKAFEAANVGDSPDAGALGLAIIQLVNDLGYNCDAKALFHKLTKAL